MDVERRGQPARTFLIPRFSLKWRFGRANQKTGCPKSGSSSPAPSSRTDTL